MLGGWSNIGIKQWDEGINPNLEFLSAFSAHQVAFAVVVSESIYFFYLRRDWFEAATGRLRLWAPTPLCKEELPKVVCTIKRIGSAIGLNSLTTYIMDRHIGMVEEVRGHVEGKGVPYLSKQIEGA